MKFLELFTNFRFIGIRCLEFLIIFCVIYRQSEGQQENN